MVRRILLALLVLVVLYVGWQWITFPDVAQLRSAPPETTAFMELRKKQLRAEGKSDDLEWRWVPYAKISPNLRRAVLVAEDNAFYEHEGVDVEGMREALKRNLKRRRITHGGSTITQQLAKNLYLSPSRNPLRKVREYFIARSLEKHLSKKRILEIYLNVVEMGERVYGAEAAARHYFGKSAASLSPREAALLAGCLPNPRVMNPGDPNKRLRARQNMILGRMRRWGYELEREVLTEKKPASEPTAEPEEVPEEVPVIEEEAVSPEEAEPPVTGTQQPETTTEAPSPEAVEPPPAEEPPPVETVPPVPTNT